MNELIKITTNEEGQQLVSARELHEFLEVKTRFNDWITGRIKKYEFVENSDFTLVTEKKVTNNPKNQISKYTDYAITIDMAKELSMVENNEKGRQARKYFIKCEEKLKEEFKNKELTEADKINKLLTLLPADQRGEYMLILVDNFYPTGNSALPKMDKPKVDLKKKAIDIFKECYDKAYYATRGQYILFYKEPIYKCASKSGITKREFNKILLEYNMVKTERGGELATCCTRIDNKNYRAIYLKAELLNSQE